MGRGRSAEREITIEGQADINGRRTIGIIIGSGNAELSAVELSRQILASVNNDLYDLGKSH